MVLGGIFACVACAPLPPLFTLRSYLACHPWDLDLTFELARRNFELKRFSDAAYLFLRVAENSEDDRAVVAFQRALEALNETAVRSEAYECYDEIDRRCAPTSFSPARSRWKTTLCDEARRRGRLPPTLL